MMRSTLSKPYSQLSTKQSALLRIIFRSANLFQALVKFSNKLKKIIFSLLLDLIAAVI